MWHQAPEAAFCCLAGSPPLLLGAVSIAFSLLAAAGVAWYVGILDFNLSREPRPTNSSGSEGAGLFALAPPL